MLKERCFNKVYPEFGKEKIHTGIMFTRYKMQVINFNDFNLPQIENNKDAVYQFCGNPNPRTIDAAELEDDLDGCE